MAKIMKAERVTEAWCLDEIHARIRSIDLKSYGSIDVDEILILREKANHADARQLDCFMKQHELESTVRRIVKEELWKVQATALR